MKLLATHPIKKMDLGFHGNLFGGKLLSAIDKCIFKKSAKEGSLLKIYSELNDIGNTSATFDVEVRSYNVFKEEEVIILTTSMTFVRIDDEGGPIPISEQVKRKFNESRTTDRSKQ